MIAIDSTSNGSNIGTSLTLSHTVSGANRLLVVGISAGSSDVVTGVTYDGITMTRVGVRNNGNSTGYMYYLLSPNTGTHNIVVSTSASVNISVEAASYTGVHQTSQPEVTTTNAATLAGTCVNTLTVIHDGALHIAMFAVDAFPVTSISNGTQVSTYMGYSLVTPAAAHTLTGTSSGGNNNWATVGASFSPLLISPSASISPSSSGSASVSASTSPSSSSSRSASSSTSFSPSESETETLSVDYIQVCYTTSYRDKYGRC